MDARSIWPSLALAAVSSVTLTGVTQAQMFAQREHVAHSENFIVFASSPEWAAQVAEVAEQHRRELAVYWLGKELPTWSERCPIHVHSSPQLGAGGETQFTLLPDRVGRWMMTVQGTRQRVLDSVLPHEITHTIFATHFAPFGDYMPRWADEGACTTVEHPAEKEKHAHFLQRFLRTGRGLSFNKMFSLKEYPSDILPLYAQGHSAVQFLLDQGGPRKFIAFIESGLRTRAWEQSLAKHYQYETIGEFQTLWNQWLADGSPSDLMAYAPGLRNSAPTRLASAETGQPNSPPSSGADAVQLAAGSQTPNPNTIRPTTIPPAQIASNHPARSGSAAGESWYKQRLRQIQSGSTSGTLADVSRPRSVPLGRSVPGPASGQASQVSSSAASPASTLPGPAQAVSRPSPSGPAGIRVLDWGQGVPVQGIESSQRSAGPVLPAPIYR